MTEDQHIKLVEVKNSFYEEFSKLVAVHIAKMPVELEREVTESLQEMSSVYGSKYDEFLPDLRESKEG